MSATGSTNGEKEAEILSIPRGLLRSLAANSLVGVSYAIIDGRHDVADAMNKEAREALAILNAPPETRRDELAGLLKRALPHMCCTMECSMSGVECTCDRDKLLDEVRQAIARAGRGE